MKILLLAPRANENQSILHPRTQALSANALELPAGIGRRIKNRRHYSVLEVIEVGTITNTIEVAPEMSSTATQMVAIGTSDPGCATLSLGCATAAFLLGNLRRAAR